MSIEDRRRAASHVLLDPDEARLLGDDTIVLPDAVEHHLRRVLRLRDGESVSVTDGVGRWRMTEVRANGSALELDATGPIVTETRTDPFTLASAIPKGDRLEWLVQKTVEVGVDRILLLHTARSAVRWKPDRAAKQLTRVRRIADEAARQSRRVWRTEIEGPVDADAVLAGAAIAEPGGTRPATTEPMIAIGPEGGWTDEELARAPRRIGLGANILRMETAAVVATTLRILG